MVTYKQDGKGKCAYCGIPMVVFAGEKDPLCAACKDTLIPAEDRSVEQL